MKRPRLPRVFGAVIGGAVIGGALAVGGPLVLGGAAAYGGVAVIVQETQKRKNRVSQLEEALRACESSLQSAQHEALEQARAKSEDAQRDSKELQEQHAEQVQRLKGDVEHLQKTMQHLQGDAGGLRSQIADLKKQIKAHEAQIPTLQEALAEKSSVATQRQVLLTGLHQQLAEKSAQVLRLNGDLTLAKDAYNTAALVQLEALAVQKKQFQEQLAEKDAELCVKDRQILQLHHSERELIGQVAYWQWRNKELLLPEQQYPDSYEVHQLASPGADLEMRRKREDLTGTETTRPFRLSPSCFSSSVHILTDTPEQPPELSTLGSGVGGDVVYDQVFMHDGQVVPRALKQVQYHTPHCRSLANAELAAFRDIAGKPGLVQCLAVFDEIDPDYQEDCLWIAMELAEGVDLHHAVQAMRKLQHVPGYAEKCHAACKLLLRQLFEVLRGLHAEGRAHGDLKFANIRVRLGEELSTHFQDLMLVDVGCSSTYKGPLGEKPANLAGTTMFISPEYARQQPDEYLDACAQDMWAAGVLTALLFGQFYPFGDHQLPDGKPDWQALRSERDSWAASYEAPDAIATCAHPVLKHLRHQMADEARYLEVATLVRQLCHPDVTARATADDALNSSLLMSQ